MNQQRLLLIAIAVLIPVWWVTRLTEAPVEPAPKNVWASPPAEVARLAEVHNSSAEPEWLAAIDTSRSECREMKEELLRGLSDETKRGLIYIGDCDKRLRKEPPECRQKVMAAAYAPDGELLEVTKAPESDQCREAKARLGMDDD